MARILLATFGTRGDVQPYLALGLHLKARGHQVTLSTACDFENLIVGNGLEPASLSVSIRDLLDQPEIRAAMVSPRGWIKAFRNSRHVLDRQNDELWAITRERRPDLIVYHPKTLICAQFARALGMVAIPSFLQPMFTPTGAFPFPLGRWPDLGETGNAVIGKAMVSLISGGNRMAHRRWLARQPELAGDWVDGLAGFHPAGRPVPRLHAHSRFIVPKPDDWSNDDHVTGYWFMPPDDDWSPPASLAAFLAAGPPPVYIGFGSMPGIDKDRTGRAVRDALSATGTRAVIARGWGAIADVGSSATVHVIDSAPHGWLFPRCAAVIHHGGAGTTHEALRWGRPSLVCPVFGDQPFWGRRVAAIGAGPPPIPLRDLTGNGLAARIQDLLSGRHDAAARSIGPGMQREKGAEMAADIIEKALPA